jgi:hypothetical protein
MAATRSAPTRSQLNTLGVCRPDAHQGFWFRPPGRRVTRTLGPGRGTTAGRCPLINLGRRAMGTGSKIGLARRPRIPAGGPRRPGALAPGNVRDQSELAPVPSQPCDACARRTEARGVHEVCDGRGDEGHSVRVKGLVAIGARRDSSGRLCCHPLLARHWQSGARREILRAFIAPPPSVFGSFMRNGLSAWVAQACAASKRAPRHRSQAA